MLDDTEWIVRKKILKWYEKNERDFPWRHTEDPYKIMIAEFMLHRTRAEQVLSVYQEFIERYPDIESLACADADRIRGVTKHLGLHWRWQHFADSARFILDEFKGKFPDEEKELRKIPGVGEYISGAILSICYGKPAKPVDSNIARFINRFYSLGLTGEIRRKTGIVVKAQKLFDCNKPGEFLFALVDFTALVCRPGKPLCVECPINPKCGFIDDQ